MYNVSIYPPVLPRVQLSVSTLLLLYPCIPQNCYKKNKNKFSHFSVASMQEVINELDYQDNRQIPDHSLLSWQIHLDQAEESQPHSPNLEGQQPPLPTVAHYNLQKVPLNFMEDRYEEVNQLINVLNTNPVSQDLIDDIYFQFCDIIKNEMEDKLPTSKPRKHKQPFHKPWWNQELEEARNC